MQITSLNISNYLYRRKLSVTRFRNRRLETATRWRTEYRYYEKETNTQILSLYRTFRMSDIQLLSREFGWYFLTFTYMKNLTTVTVEITSPIVNKTPSLKNWIFEGKRNVNNTHLWMLKSYELQWLCKLSI